ncbi:MAG: Rne/Rng family ribonuclease [Alphaproteobacteria bacterium]|nr:Rne/Rng family ribonuclease [Alphaproteobacteria bacterium]
MLNSTAQKEILISVGAAEFRAAIVENGGLQDLVWDVLIGADERSSPRRLGRCRSRLGEVILGRVQKVMSGMQAAFIDVGMERAGFLGIREARCLAEEQAHGDEDLPAIGTCVREGAEIVVQIIKDPMGDKGARLTASISIPGRLLVLTPHRSRVAVSRRIVDEPERDRLTALCNLILADFQNAPLSRAGFIVRSAAAGADLAELRADAERLAEVWQGILAAWKGTRAPVTLHRDLAPIERTLRDELDAQTSRIVIDDLETVEAARAYCRRTMPDAEARLDFFSGPGTLFDRYGIEDCITQLGQPRVPLPSGGWITIESTEALTAIDVNSGSFIDAGGLEETSLRVNREAAREIGRHLRLRGIGGVTIVDFIHMTAPGSKQQVLDALAAALSRDRAPTQISPISEFGLVAITRKRVRDPLTKRVTERCPACHGDGRIRSCESVGFDILRQVERAAVAAPGSAIAVRAAPDVVRWIAVHEDEVRAGLARRGASRVSFEAREEFRREGFDVATEP